MPSEKIQKTLAWLDAQGIPCDNTARVVLTNEMFMKFLALWGGEYGWIEV